MVRIMEGARFSAPVRAVPGALPAFYTMGIGSSSEVKRPGRGVDLPPPPSGAEVEGRVELYICSPLWAYLACSRENFTFTFYRALGL